MHRCISPLESVNYVLLYSFGLLGIYTYILTWHSKVNLGVMRSKQTALTEYGSNL